MMKVTGLDVLQRRLRHLEKAGAKRANRKATRAATTVLGKFTRAETPRDEGLTRKMQTTAVRGDGLTMSGKAGADVAKLKAAAKATGDDMRPSNIDWLIEYGHVNPDGTFIPPTGFMRRAAAKGQPAAEAAYARKLAQEIEREAMR